MTSLAFGPKGTQLITGCTDTKVRIHDGVTGKIKRVIEGHEKFVHAVAYAPTGDHFASAADTGRIRIYDRDGDEQARWSGHDAAIWALRFTRDGKTLISTSHDGTVRLWDVETQKERRRLTAEGRHFVAFDMNAKETLLAAGGRRGEIRIWRLSDEDAKPRVLKGHVNTVFALAFHPTRPVLASTGADYTIRIWDLTTGKELGRTNPHGTYTFSLAWHPSGTTLVSGGGDNAIRLHRVTLPKSRRTHRRR